MKPVLHCILTAEDFDIWLRVARAPDTRLALRHLYTCSVVMGDRRDAALIHALTHQDVNCDVCWQGMPLTWRPQGFVEKQRPSGWALPVMAAGEA